MAKKRVNQSIYIPGEQVPITLDAEIDPPLRALECEAAGTVVIVDINDVQMTRTVVAGKRLDLQIQMVKSGGTIAAASLVGLR